MNDLTRRRLGLLGGATAVGTGLAASPARAATAPTPVASAAVIGPGDARYQDLVRGINYRFIGQPDHVRLATTVAQVRGAVADAVRENRTIAVRSGGHCLEGFVGDPAVRAVIDLSQLTGVYADLPRGAVVVEAGATLGTVYEVLFKRWGVTVPGGVGPQIGAGGHISGGGYGALSRLHGLVVDYLNAVEVVVVDVSGQARTVVATAAADDPNHDLWWAHTGGGGGNFGVVTRYWLRDPHATGNSPATWLPQPPAALLLAQYRWPWAQLDETSYTRIVANFTRWHEANSAPGAPERALFAVLSLNSVNTGDLGLTVQVDATAPNAAGLLRDFVAALGEGTSVAPVGNQRTLPWWDAFRYSSFADFGPGIGNRVKLKSSYLRKSYTPAQLATLYRWLSRAGYPGRAATVLLAGYGGRINSLRADERAIPQRDSVIKAQYSVRWIDPAEDELHLSWVRGLYRELFADTGGVPVPGDRHDGAYINYPDVDLADAAWNTSSTAWSTLYYKGNYPRLRQIKKRWDPQDRFHHALAVRPAE
ncbi:FAD-binding protein [Frankia sp. AgPm24]|uniref:FAD-binding oxidoreductase n=1 Tax=Frankia sp. AgPm24 TaxID=631128 RepID=UPI00200E5394|nr:FAD-binding protein [Frankia sp. AgPm24]MCK9924922.1 FAD-binding protein [Frankia sp. AgPm24]